MEMLEVSHVSKNFGKNKVLEDLCLSVRENTIFGFIGQNGAGKTTTLKLILGLLRPDEGEIFVHGKKVRFGQTDTNRWIGYLADVPEFYGFLTPREYLTLCAGITGMSKEEGRRRIEELLELAGLVDADRKIKGFSRGMKQRLGIAQALLNRPRLLICDEPTSALDPLGRREILEILADAKKDTAVLFSTHILSDVERICDEIAFLSGGQIAACGTLEEMKRRRRGSGFEVELLLPEDAADVRSRFPSCRRLDALRLRFAGEREEEMFGVMQYLSQRRIQVQKVERLEPTLEDLFMEAAGK